MATEDCPGGCPGSSGREGHAGRRGNLSGCAGYRGLIQLADKIIRKGRPDEFDYTYGGFPEARKAVRHPYDDKVWIGGIAALLKLPKDVDAIVSLCRVSDMHLPAGVKQLDVRLIDREGANENANLDFVLLDTVRAIEQLRAEGRTVFVSLRPGSQPHTHHRCAVCSPQARCRHRPSVARRGGGAAGLRPEHRFPRGAGASAAETRGRVVTQGFLAGRAHRPR